MWEIALALVILGGMALAGFMAWLSRVHPLATPVDATEDIRNKLVLLQDEINEMKLGRGLRSNQEV